MSESGRIFPDISECDRACGRVCLRKLAVPIEPSVYMGVVPLGSGRKADPDEPVPEDVAPRVPPSSGPGGGVPLSDEVMPIAMDDNLLRKFEVWSNAPLVLAPRRPWYTRIWRLPRAWVPGTLEWRFRRWASGRATVVSE